MLIIVSIDYNRLTSTIISISIICASNCITIMILYFFNYTTKWVIWGFAWLCTNSELTNVLSNRFCHLANVAQLCHTFLRNLLRLLIRLMPDWEELPDCRDLGERKHEACPSRTLGYSWQQIVKQFCLVVPTSALWKFPLKCIKLK